MTVAHCCICDELTNTIDAETADSIRVENSVEPLCDSCARLSDAELSRRYDLNHKEASA